MAETIKWLVLVYKIPPEPSRYRVALWRRLKGAGAVYLQNSVCALPDCEVNRDLFRALSEEIREAGGESLLLSSQALDQAEQGKVLERYNAERDLEYGEFIEQCLAFLEELRHETEKNNFTFGELEENEEELEKLVGWLSKIQGRDSLGASRAGEAKEFLNKSQEAFESFSKKVFEANNVLS